MPALFPSMVAPEVFQVGDCVRKFVSEQSVTPFIGVVAQVCPTTYKVWVQWPTENTQEDPETLIKVNPLVSGMPTSIIDRGYGSYEKGLSERKRGQIPRRITPSRDLPPMRVTATEKAVIRIAHTFATEVVGKLVDDICKCYKNKLSDVQAYNRIFQKYGTICSDHIIKASIGKVYSACKE